MWKDRMTTFVFAVFLISLLTDGYIYGVISAILGVLAVNYAFTFPYFQWDFITTSNLISAVIMVIIAILTGTLTTKLKEHEAMKAESEKERMHANLLRAISHDLGLRLRQSMEQAQHCGKRGKVLRQNSR